MNYSLFLINNRSEIDVYNINKIANIMKRFIDSLDIIRKMKYREIDQIGYTLIPQNTNINVSEYTDSQYRKRRVEIGEMSKLHKMGQRIAEV